MKTISILFAGASALSFSTLAHAQEIEPVEPAAIPMEITEEAEEADAAVPAESAEGMADETGEATSEDAAEGTGEEYVQEINPDDMADMLNSQQQLQQSFTLERRIDGEVVEQEKRTVTYDRSQPYRETEAGGTIKEKLKAAFDGEVLTRVEAFNEAKMDFTLGDKDRDGRMTLEEFKTLTETWRDNSPSENKPTSQEEARQRQYEAFLAEISPEAAKMQNEAYATEKFRFMAGASDTITRNDYVREYLLDFDSMDTDKDMMLKGDELMKFRALNRGETIDM